jgi:hypothetical protein
MIRRAIFRKLFWYYLLFCRSFFESFEIHYWCWFKILILSYAKCLKILLIETYLYLFPRLILLVDCSLYSRHFSHPFAFDILIFWGISFSFVRTCSLHFISIVIVLQGCTLLLLRKLVLLKIVELHCYISWTYLINTRRVTVYTDRKLLLCDQIFLKIRRALKGLTKWTIKPIFFNVIIDLSMLEFILLHILNLLILFLIF